MAKHRRDRVAPSGRAPGVPAALLAAIAHLIGDVAQDAKKIKPGELLRLLNSTPLGPVLTDRRLREHRARAGLRVGDGKSIDLLRYVAWLAGEPRQPVSPAAAVSQETPDAGDAYERKKEGERRRQSLATRKGQDIGAIPPIGDAARRAAAADSFQAFCESYFPDWFALEWSPDHLAVIERIELSVTEGGLYAVAMPRGTGKSTLCECAVLWVLLNGKHKFVALIGASAEAAKESLENIKSELENNELLKADFPEVCYPIECLGGQVNKQAGQHCQGKRTRITWGKATVVLPTIEGSVASAGVVKAAGLTARVRGMRYARPDGTIARPTLAIPDDPQTDRTADSDRECDKRVKLLMGAVLKLAGPGQKMAAVMPCTVIRQGDMADRILDAEKYPQWHGHRYKLVYDFPTNTKLWDEYAALRRAELQRGGDGSEATKFYKKNRKAMDAGARVAWPARFNPDELSAIQHAMNRFIDDEASFWAEDQNTPLSDRPDDGDLPTAVAIASKINNLPRAMIPLNCSHLVSFVDVHHDVLYWMAVAWTEDGFGGAVVDYGTWPEQGRAFFRKRNATKKLGQLYSGQSMVAAVKAGLSDLLEKLLAREWQREGGGAVKIERCLIDAKDGAVTDALTEVLRRHQFAAILLPCGGKGIGADETPMHRWKVSDGEKNYGHAVLRRSQKHAIRWLTIDSNFWKSFVQRGLATPAGERSAITLFGKSALEHQMLAEHLTAEKRDRVTSEKTGLTVDLWRHNSAKSDNHLFDCLAGAAAAGMLQGCSELFRPSRLAKKPVQRRRVQPLF